MYHEVTNVIPVNHPPNAKNAQGNKSNPDHPMNTKRSRFNQSSTNPNTPILCYLTNCNCHILEYF